MSESGESQLGSWLSPEADLQPQVSERVVLETDCEGHFKDGIKILPAFRMLEQFTDQMVSSGEIPSQFHMAIGDMLPAGVNYTSRYDHISSTRKLVLHLKNGITITGESAPLELVEQSELFGPVDTSPINPDRILLDKVAIQEIIPQGPNIQFIDAVIKPHSYQPKVLAEAIHTITGDDYVRQGISDRFYFNRSRLLEGLGQLAYIHFRENIKTAKPMTPFFEKVDGYFTKYQPQIGETIHYQLNHFEVDFTDRGDKGSGIISGLVMDGHGTLVIAKFTATVGAAEPRRLEKIAGLAHRQSLKSTPPEQI